MKALLHFRTALGPRTIVAEIGDAETARAIVNAQLANGEQASLVEEMPRISMKQHMASHKRKRAKIKLVSSTPSNVLSIRKAKARV